MKDIDFEKEAADLLGGVEPVRLEALTMRDAFAAVVLAGFNCRGMEGSAVALRCYEVADAMMAERAEFEEVEPAQAPPAS